MNSGSRQRTWILWGLLAASLVFAAIFSEGYFHADEHFQILEFANYQMGNLDPQILPWEFHYQMRPTVQVFLATGVTELTDGLGMSRFDAAFVLRILTALLSMLTLHSLFRMLQLYYPDTQNLKQIFPAMALIFVVPLLGVRYSSEIWSGALFFLGFSVFDGFRRKKKIHLLVLAITLFTLSFWCRFHTAFMTLTLLVWWMANDKPVLRQMLIAAGSALGVLLFGVILDRMFYGDWVFTPWNYLDHNILQGTMNEKFGTQPVWFYLQQLFERPTPFFLLILIPVTVLVVRKRKHANLLWPIGVFLIIHHVVGHKELRFLFPLVFCVPLLLTIGWVALEKRYHAPIVRHVFVILNIIVILLFGRSPANMDVATMRFIDENNIPTVYYTNHDPLYAYGMYLSYYRPDESVQRIKLSSREAIPDDSFLLRASYKDLQSLNPEKFNVRIIASAIPAFVIRHFNFGNWASRSTIQGLFLLTPKKGL